MAQSPNEVKGGFTDGVDESLKSQVAAESRSKNFNMV